MPQWIHDRADRIRAENPEMPESESFAIATQQAHKLGKTPKGYGTAEGKREAMRKYDESKREYQKTAGVKRILRIADSIVRKTQKGKEIPEGLIEAATSAGRKLEHAAGRRELGAPASYLHKHMTDKHMANLLKSAGLLRPDQPRARDIVKGRGPEARQKRIKIREDLREGCPMAKKREKTAMLIGFFNEFDKISAAKKRKEKSSQMDMPGAGASGAMGGPQAAPPPPPPPTPPPSGGMGGAMGGMGGGM